MNDLNETFINYTSKVLKINLGTKKNSAQIPTILHEDPFARRVIFAHELKKMKET